MSVTINIADIRVNGGTQSRAAIDRGVVSDYADAIRDGAVFPPITVFFDGSSYWLGDGFHRYEAYSAAQVYDVPADIRQGTQRDAILFSVGANASHGLRRTNDDKRRAVLTLLNDPEWSTWSAREIARACGVSHDYAARMKREVSSDDSERTYTTKHGTTATMQTANIGASSNAGQIAPEPEAPVARAYDQPEAREPAPASNADQEPVDPERKKIARLTPEAMIDEIMGLRADLADEKAKASKLKDERDELKTKLAEACSGDLGRALGNAQRRADTATGRMREYMAAAKRLEWKLKQAEARVKELESMEVSFP